MRIDGSTNTDERQVSEALVERKNMFNCVTAFHTCQVQLSLLCMSAGKSAEFIQSHIVNHGSAPKGKGGDCKWARLEYYTGTMVSKSWAVDWLLAILLCCTLPRENGKPG